MKKSGQEPSFGQGLELSVIMEKALANAVKKTNADSNKIQGIIGKPGVVFDFFEKLLADDIKSNPSILRLISDGEKIMIEASDGKAYISNAKKIFKSSISKDFKNWGLNQWSGAANTEILLDVSELVGDGTFIQIFTEITSDLGKLIMTQAQIIRFCKKHPIWLREEQSTTLFLMKVGGEYFVVRVDTNWDGLGVCVYRLGCSDVWYGVSRFRIVSPQLNPLTE